MVTYSDERIRSDGLWGNDSRSTYRPGRRQGRPPSALAHVFGILFAVIAGSSIILFSLDGGTTEGLSAVALAASVPLAGLLWGLTLAFLSRSPKW